MPLRLDLVEVGTRVSYEDMANPRREGRVVEILEHGGRTTQSGLPLPGGTEYRVVWDDPEDADRYGPTISDLRQHGWHIIANLPGNLFDGADIISAYTRLDAIRDGFLVPTADLVPDEPNFAREAGWKVPVCLSSALAAIAIPTEWEEARYQDVKGRLWDILSMARMYGKGARQHGMTTEWFFPCIFVLGPADARKLRRAGRATLHLKAVIGPDDDMSPVLTISLREEN